MVAYLDARGREKEERGMFLPDGYFTPIFLLLSLSFRLEEFKVG